MAQPVRVAILLADYGNDPTETAIPFQTFTKAGYEVTFVTEDGATPRCDEKMTSGWTQKLLGADQTALKAYRATTASGAWKQPQAWTSPDFSLSPFDVVYIPGGHDKGVRQMLDSRRLQTLLAAYFPLTRKPSDKVCAALCHGVQMLAHSKYEGGDDGDGQGHNKGKSVLHDVTATTALPDFFEDSVYSATRWVLGDYYKTYGAGTPNVAQIVRDSLDDPKRQFKSSSNPLVPFVVADETYNYLSARWPGDALVLAKRVIELVDKVRERGS